MRFLADENFPKATVDALKAGGHDVDWVRLSNPGASDTAILAQVAREGLVLLTLDKDFGELAVRQRLPGSCGVVLLRVPPPRSVTAATSLAAQIAARQDWAGHFSVIEPGRVRMRPLR